MSLGPTAKPNVQVTGKVLPGMVKTGQSPRKAESLSVSKVADITTTFKGKGLPLVALEKSFFSKPRRISCNTYTHLLNVCFGRLAGRGTILQKWYMLICHILTHCVEAAFVDFIQDYNTVLRKNRICQDLSEQAAVRHVLHLRALAQTQSHLHLITHLQRPLCAGDKSWVPLTCDVQSSKRTW